MDPAGLTGREVGGSQLGDRQKAALPSVGRRGLIAGLSLAHVLPARAAIVDEETAERIFDSVGCTCS